MIGWYLECSSHVFFRCGRKANNITHTCYRACYELNIVSKMFLGKVSFQLLLPSSFVVVVVVVKLTTLISFLSVLTPHNLILHVYCPFHRTHTRYLFCYTSYNKLLCRVKCSVFGLSVLLLLLQSILTICGKLLQNCSFHHNHNVCLLNFKW